MARATVTKRFELSQEAADELERRAKMCGMSQTAFVQDLIMSGMIQPVDSTLRHGTVVRASYSDRVGSTGEDVPSLKWTGEGYDYQSNPDVKAAQARTEKKAARAGRKAELGEQARAGLKAITGALPDFPDIGPSVESGRGKASVELRPLERGRVEPLTKPGKR